MFIYRDYKWRDLPKLVHRTVKTVTIVMILIGFAACFGYIMTLMQIPLKITLLHQLSDNRYVILADDQRAAAGAGHADGHGAADPDPDAHPAAGGQAIGVDPVHFGMIMMVNLGIGLITPARRRCSLCRSRSG
jgi:TRAP-type C4-dicarboxylate transport system permease large subunit